MLKIEILGEELFDDETNTFVEQVLATIELEHSLVSLAAWEARWEKPFLGYEEKTPEETLSYVELMVQTPNVPKELLLKLSSQNYKVINDYIEAKNTATWFNDRPDAGKGREIITAEVIYYWMLGMNVPKECEHWHLNRLFTLLKVINEKNAPKKKLSQRELIERQRTLNAQRKSELKTSG